MLKTLTVTNYVGDSITIDVRDPESSGFLITEIEGMDSPGSNINTTEVPTNDGNIFNSARLKSRDIQIKMRVLHPVETNRLKLYKYFPAKRPITLTFLTESRHASIVGYVESMESNPWSEAVTADISLQCPTPYFEDVYKEILKYSNMEECFEFPFDPDESTTEIRMISKNAQGDKVVGKYYIGGSSGITTEVYGEDGSGEIFPHDSYVVLTDTALESVETLLEKSKPYTKYDKYYVSSEGLYSTTGTYVIYIPCEKYKRYYITKTIGNRFRIGFSDSVPVAGTTPITLMTQNDIFGEEVKLDAMGKYMILYFCNRENYIAPATVAANIKMSSDTVPNIELSSRTSVYIKNIPYHGDVETGCIFTLHATGVVKNIQIYNMDTRETIAIKGQLNSGEDWEICTIQNRKYAHKISGGIRTSVLNKIVRDSDWLKLYKGDNRIAYIASEGIDNVELSITTEVFYEGL